MVKVIDVPYELPKGWEWVRLINITSRIHYGYTASALTEGDAKLLRITDIQKNRVNWESVPYCNISNTKLDDMQLINGDIVIARTGGTLGKSFHIMDLTDVAVFASYLIRLQSVDIKNSFFNKRFLESFEYWKQLDKISGGTGQPNVNATNLGLLLIPVPPEKEQSRILNKIYNLFEDVNLIDSEQQYLTNLSEQLKQKVLDIAMQGKLVPQDPNDGPASVLLEKIRAEKQRLFEEGKLKKKDLVETEIVKGDDNAYYEKDSVSNLNEISIHYERPKGWLTSRVLDMIFTIPSKKYQIKQSDIKPSGRYPVISQSANEIEGYSCLDSKVFHISEPLVIFGDHTRNLKLVSEPFIVGADGVKILSSIYSEPEFLKLQLQQILQFVKDRGYARYWSYLEKEWISFPSLLIQEKIIHKINQVDEAVDLFLQ